MTIARSPFSGSGMLRGIAALIVLSLGTAGWAAGGGGGGGGGFSGGASSPRELGAAYFEKGETYRKAAVEALERAAAATTDAERAEATALANAKLKRALREYKQAVRADRTLHFAWNGQGFTQRMLGDYEAALKSYDRALKLEPGFPYAVEYRGEAYLMLGRLDDAKAAYMDLFGRERPFADLLLRKMQAWVAQKKAQPAADDAAQLDGFAQWVAERAALAMQTASLAPEASAVASW